jgi:hypothetical protein
MARTPPKTRKPAKPRDDRDPATGRFVKGKSGNPKGSQPGYQRNPFQKAAGEIITPEVATKAVQVLTTRMLQGDSRAAALLFGVMPKPRWPLVDGVKPIMSAEDAVKLMARVAADTVCGDIATEDSGPALAALAATASALSGISDLRKLAGEIETMRRMIERRGGTSVDGAEAQPLPWENGHGDHQHE